jgi:apolipoprotein N-acyltransferase
VFKSGHRENAREAFGKLLDSVAAVKPDIVVMAESAMVEFGSVRSFRAKDVVREFFDRSGARYIMAGGDDTVSGRTYNAIALYTRGVDGPVDVYHKQHLVPFGEYIPFDKWIPALQKLSPIGVSLWPGEAKVFRLKDFSLAPIICYEDTDSAQARRLAEMGARALCFITNDSWFSQSDEAVQHAWQAVARAIETGLPVLRVGNSGVTGSIAADGTASWLKGADGRELVDTAATMCDALALGDAGRAPTPYVRLGDKPLVGAFLLLLAVLFVPRRRRATVLSTER